MFLNLDMLTVELSFKTGSHTDSYKRIYEESVRETKYLTDSIKNGLVMKVTVASIWWLT